MPSLILRQSRRYAEYGLGFLGSLLKHSLVPLEVLCDVLPERGLMLDLGSGEGMLSNLIAWKKRGLKVRGLDLNAQKIAAANANAPSNASFEVGDVLNASFSDADAIVLNDMLHHHPLERQNAILKRAGSWLKDGGVLILKEVDKDDRSDAAWTGYWDRKLYPNDVLTFRSRPEWEQVLSENGFRVLRVHYVAHPWPASRTVFICRYEKRTAAPVRKENPLAIKVLITGATGFIGGHLAAHLHEHGIGGKPVELTALVRYPARVPPSVADHCVLWTSTLEGLPEHAARLKTFDYVFHLAADKDFYGGRKVFDHNLQGTQALVHTLIGSLQLKRFVFASSMGAVDRSSGDACEAPISETTPAVPTSWYGRAKLESEKLIRESSLPYSIVRLPWCYGPGMSPATHIRALTEKVENGFLMGTFNWPGRISVLDVKEAARAMAQLAAIPQASGQIYNVAEPEPVTFGALFRAMGDMVGKPAGQRPIPDVFIGLGILLRRWLPFTLRCLLMDVLWIEDQKLRAHGVHMRPRSGLFLLPLVRWMNQEKKPSAAASTFIVTGAASGIGHALCVRLAASGYTLLRVDKNMAAGAPLLLGDAITSDLSVPDDLDLVRQVLNQPHVYGLINCAGVAFLGKAGDLPDEKVKTTLQVNVEALTLLSGWAAKRFEEAGSGVIVNIASSAAFQPLAYMAVYAASKAYVLHFSEALGAELEDRGVPVITVCPSGTTTRFQERAGVRTASNEKLLSPAFIAAETVQAIENRRTVTLLIGNGAWIMSEVSRLLPRGLSARLWKGMMLKTRCPEGFQKASK